MKILSVLTIVLAVGLAGCGDDGVGAMGKDAAMKLVSSAMEKAGSLTSMLGGITNGETAKAAKEKLGGLIPAFIGLKDKVTKIPEPVQKLVGGKFGDVTKMFGTIKEKAGSLIKIPDVKAQLGGMLGKLIG